MEMADNPILSVDFKHYYDNVSEGVSFHSRACIDMGALQGGLIKKVGANRLPLLIVILSFMDKEGRAFPSQRKLAELTGQSVNTVNKLVNELLEIEVDGQKLLRRDLVGKGKRNRSMYYIHSGEVTNTDMVKLPSEDQDSEEKKEALKLPTEIKVKPMGTGEISAYFNEEYVKAFGQPYAFDYKREMSIIKNKLVGKYDDETLKGTINIAVSRYSEKWANPNYIRPSVAMVCGWLFNQALAIYQQDQKKDIEQEIREKTAKEQDDTDRALELFDI